MNLPSTPRQLMTRLGVYFVVLLGSVTVVIATIPATANWMPIGGTDAIEMAQLKIESVSFGTPEDEIVDTRIARPDSAKKLFLIFVFLAESLSIAMLIMLPIAWTYQASRPGSDGQMTFVHALFALPICATTIVLLIQGSLALAFGLAAMVAAVRFRVRLQEPIDAIYIFAAICVGLAGGIGYLGVATVMAIFFCFGNAVLWMRDGGRQDAA